MVLNNVKQRFLAKERHPRYPAKLVPLAPLSQWTLRLSKWTSLSLKDFGLQKSILCDAGGVVTLCVCLCITLLNRLPCWHTWLSSQIFRQSCNGTPILLNSNQSKAHVAAHTDLYVIKSLLMQVGFNFILHSDILCVNFSQRTHAG
jgi:hypothetical protein